MQVEVPVLLYSYQMAYNFSLNEINCAKIYQDYGFSPPSSNSLCTNSTTFNFTDINVTSNALVNLFVNFDTYWSEIYNELLSVSGIDSNSLYSILYSP